MCPTLNTPAAVDGTRAGTDPSWEPAEQQGDRDLWAGFCAECGACLAVCPAARFGLNYDPRAIVLKMRYGLADRLVTADSVVWQCFQCRRCGETCPQPVKPFEMVGWLREMLMEHLHGRPPRAAQP